ncbi:MAG: molybdopterin-dependent oxidoreductase [Myxococcales bacterium]|nr:molybdopterin-dependent oxidoreductase [Myxococcales bacterium]
MSSIDRRQFIKITAGSFGAAALASGLVSDWWGATASAGITPDTDGDNVVPTFCELCFWKCGVLAHVKNGRVTKIVGNPKHPLSRGRLCPRGTGGTGLLYDPDRLQKPLVRVSKRGEQRFEPVSWDAALNRVAEGMERIRKAHGPEALALFYHGFGGSWFKRLFKSFGSPNIAAPSYAQCRGPREVGFELTYGQGVGSPEPVDIENTRCLTLIGSHLGENTHNTQVQDMARAIERGADLVVVDPRFSIAAGKAKYWLPIKPGTDIALLLAWMNVIISEQRYDADFVAKHTVGFDKLKAHVADKTPEWAYPLTGIAPQLIRESGRFIASQRPASLVHPGRRATWYGDDAQRSRAVAILSALLGSWGRRGGYLLPTSMEVPGDKYPKSARKPHRPRADRLPGKHPLAGAALASGLCDATVTAKPYPIKGWMVYGTNLMQALPDPRHTRAAIEKLDLLVAIDVLPAEIVGWADVVLPEATYLERTDDLHVPAYKEPYVALRQQVVPPMYESKPGWWIAKQLGERLGLGAQFNYQSSEDVVRRRAAAAKIDFAALARDGVVLGKRVPACRDDGLPAPSFDTPSKKVELYSDQLAKLGFHPMPEPSSPEEPPQGMFRLLTGRAPMHTFGRTTNNRQLGELMSENEVWINRAAARALPGFEDPPLRTGDKVVLVNQDGIKSTPIKARVTERIRGDCVYMVHGFGHSARGLRFARGRGACDSDLVTRVKVDPLMGGTGMNVNFVRIAKAEVRS